jgi:hypothetical protein
MSEENEEFEAEAIHWEDEATGAVDHIGVVNGIGILAFGRNARPITGELSEDADKVQYGRPLTPQRVF